MDPQAAEELFDLARRRGLISGDDAARVAEIHGRLSDKAVLLQPIHIAIREGLLTEAQVAALVPDAPAARARYPTAHPVGERGSLAGNVLLGRIDGYPRRAGGAAAVFLAQTEHGLRAAKVYPPSLDLVPAFLESVRRVAAVAEPSGTLVRTFGAGTSSGYPFAILEHVVARPLDLSLRRRKERRLRDAKLVEMAKAVLRVLVALEAAGIRHGAIRPSAILLDANNRVRVLPPCFLRDAAARVGAGNGAVPEVARSLLARRSPDYLAPEDARGEPAVGPAGDLYALGIVLFEARAGRLPFPGAGAALAERDPNDTDDAPERPPRGSSSSDELGSEDLDAEAGPRGGLPCAVDSLRQRIARDVPPLREVVRDVPAWLDLVVWKLTRRDPARRYRSAREALADLLRATDPERKVIPGVDDPTESETGRLPPIGDQASAGAEPDA